MTDHDTPTSDAWLEALLRDGAHVDEAGFTDGVVARLPARRKRVSARTVALGAFALAAAAVGAASFAHVSASVFALDAVSLGAVGVVVVALGLWGALASAEA